VAVEGPRLIPAANLGKAVVRAWQEWGVSRQRKEGVATFCYLFLSGEMYYLKSKDRHPCIFLPSWLDI